MPLTPAAVLHYCYRYYTNDTPWNTETVLPQNSNEVVPGEKCRGSIHAAKEYNPDWKN